MDNHWSGLEQKFTGIIWYGWVITIKTSEINWLHSTAISRWAVLDAVRLEQPLSHDRSDLLLVVRPQLVNSENAQRHRVKIGSNSKKLDRKVHMSFLTSSFDKGTGGCSLFRNQSFYAMDIKYNKETANFASLTGNSVQYWWMHQIHRQRCYNNL